MHQISNQICQNDIFHCSFYYVSRPKRHCIGRYSIQIHYMNLIDAFGPSKSVHRYTPFVLCLRVFKPEEELYSVHLCQNHLTGLQSSH